MSFYAYVIQSKKHGRFYIGSCEDMTVRLERHNDGMTRSTKNGIPWIVKYTEIFETRSEAMRREKQIKSYKGGEAFKRLMK